MLEGHHPYANPIFHHACLFSIHAVKDDSSPPNLKIPSKIFRHGLAVRYILSSFLTPRYSSRSPPTPTFHFCLIPYYVQTYTIYFLFVPRLSTLQTHSQPSVHPQSYSPTRFQSPGSALTRIPLLEPQHILLETHSISLEQYTVFPGKCSVIIAPLYTDRYLTNTQTYRHAI